MAHHKIEFDCECKSCNGTGLYVGLAERDGAAVVCHSCKGTGCQHCVIEYDDFKGRARKSKVRRVFEVNVGVMIGAGTKDFGGMPYKDWQEGKPFPPGSENRKYTCPAWWYQSADYSKKPKWEECCAIGSFSDCSRFCNKEYCWQRWDAEIGKIKANK